MSKNIVIIGGGISGLALLHYAKQRCVHHKDIQVTLLEKNDYLGGTIRSLKKKECLFETGPNGFLDSKPRTLEFVKDLGLERSLLTANEESRIRHLSVKNKLHPLPTTPQSFLFFKPLNPFQKLRVLWEFFVPKGDNPKESVYDFGKRRLGEKFSKVFLDPMVSGIYGGDAQKANLKAVFPRIYALEQAYGSLFKALIQIRKIRKAEEKNGKPGDDTMGGPAGTLTSFHGGVSQLIEALGERYKENICLNWDAESVFRQKDQYRIVSADGRKYVADELFICAPAYSAGPMVKNVNAKMCEILEKIHYAPIAVVGLVFPLGCFKNRPKGYGYLIPSSEKKETLGVLFESNIFPERCPEDQILLRVMIGGARHPEVVNKTREELIGLALNEIESSLGMPKGQNLEECFFICWNKAIPQYDNVYCEDLPVLEGQLQKTPGLHLVANYLKGVSLNDCIENAYQAAQTIATE